MEETKKSKKPWIFGIIGVIALIAIGIAIYDYYNTQRANEMWAFRDTLDKTFFPVQDEIDSCVFTGTEEEQQKKGYKCQTQDLLDRNQETKDRISAYEVKSDDAKQLKNEVLNGVAIINHILKDNGPIVQTDTKALIEQTSNLVDDKTDLNKNSKKIYNILIQYYH